MCSTRRLGPTPLCVDVVLLVPLGAKNAAAHNLPDRMRVRDGKPTPGGGCRTGVCTMRGPAGWPRRTAGGRSAAVERPPADPAGPCCGVVATPPPSIGRRAAHRLPHAALSALDARGARMPSVVGQGRQGGQRALRFLGRASHAAGSLSRHRPCRAHGPAVLPSCRTPGIRTESHARRPDRAHPPAARPEAAGA